MRFIWRRRRDCRAQMSHGATLYPCAVRDCRKAGKRCWKRGDSALDVVDAVRLLKACPLFNAVYRRGLYPRRNSRIWFTRQYPESRSRRGRVSHALAILCRRQTGDIKRPHVLMVGKGRKTLPFHRDGARFAGYLSTPARYEQLPAARAVVKCMLDRCAAPLDETKKWYSRRGGAGIPGNSAAATSTGGMTNKLLGRVGDSSAGRRRVLCQQRQRRRFLYRNGEVFVSHACGLTISPHWMEISGDSGLADARARGDGKNCTDAGRQRWINAADLA